MNNALPKELNSNEISEVLREGLALHKQGYISQAKAFYEKALCLDSKDSRALFLMGVIACDQGDYEISIEFINNSLIVNPVNFEGYLHLSNAQLQLGQIVESLASCERAIQLNPASEQAHFNRGNLLFGLNRFDEALSSLRLAITIKSNFAEAYLSQGSTLKQLGHFQEAYESIEKAILYRENYAQAYYSRGVVLQELNLLEAAIESYDEAIRLNPDYAEAYLNKSIALLTLGKYQQAWSLYEMRWHKEKRKLPATADLQARWSGQQVLAGKTVLVYAEQGLGDTIQFYRYVEGVSQLGANVILQVPTPLVPLFEGLKGEVVVIEEGAPVPPYDFHCALMSLPGVFGTELTTIPNAKGYLTAAPDKSNYWVTRLGQKKGLRVGLVWSGALRTPRDNERSLSLRQLLRFLPKDLEYFCLQKEVRDADRVELCSHSVNFFVEEIHDFADTAALCDLMDLIISVDTSVVHLAGAMGKPTWVLLPFLCDWRWLREREDSPWYASMRLFRQGVDRQWPPVLERITQEIHSFFASPALANPPDSIDS
jgi:tetratricopeptide (TPR) repeat protein